MIAEQLRKSILQAAIQGKLTEQLPEDGDARDLLKEIQKEKARLIKEGKIKKEKPLSEIAEDEIPFEIPDNWCWVRLGEVISLKSGKDMTPDKYGNIKNGIPYITGASNFLNGILTIDRWTYEPQSIAEEGDLLITCKGTIGEMAFLKENKAHIARQVMAIRQIAYLNLQYVYLYLIVYVSQLKTMAKSMIPGISRNMVLEAIIPLPPLAEQQRIVERLEQILPELDKLYQYETKLEALQKAFPKKMKDSLLQYAIQGKLTEQLPEDGDARDLLKEIEKEKARLIKEGKIKKEKPLPEITEDEIPFEIPDNWCWVRLNVLCEYIQRGKSPKYSPIKKYPVIAQKCNQWEGFSIEKALFIDPETVSKYTEERSLRDEDLMWNSTGLGTLGRMAIYYDNKNPYGFAVADSHVTVIRTHKEYVYPKYIFLFISGPYIQSIVEDISSGSTKQKELATETVKKLLIPFPPLAEQIRIIQRLDELIPLCKMLE